MKDKENEFSFWKQNKRFATSEILLYVIMVLGIGLGILIFG